MIFKDRIQDIYGYTTEDIKFLILILVLMIVLSFIVDYKINPFLTFFVQLIIFGYGLEITHFTINGVNRLPKLRPKQILIKAIKSLIVTSVYLIPQFLFQRVVIFFSGFNKIYELNEVFLHIGDFEVMFQIDPFHFIVYLVLFLVLAYIFFFFYEISLARLAHTNSLRSAFQIRTIIKIIRDIGFKYYVVEYTELIVIISSLLFLSSIISDFIPVLSSIIGFFVFFFEFRSIGLLYSECSYVKS